MPNRPAASTVASPSDDGLATFLNVRPRLLAIAHRMLGSATDAEDVVQDVWVRWQTADRGVVRDASAFLATTTTRAALNVIRSARYRRERRAERSPIEPVDLDGDPRLRVERSEAVASAVQILLEKLSRAERSAYVLREAFDYSYREIAAVLRLEVANTRQLVSRARQHVVCGRRLRVGSGERRRLLRAFLHAAQGGDVAGLIR